MRNFFFKVISSVLKSIIVFIILFFLAISFYSGKFPPSLKLAKDSIKQLTEAKEKYQSLLHKSEAYLQQMPDETSGNYNDVPVANNSTTENVSLQLRNIQSQLNRIEEQNRQILSSLNK